MRCGGKIGSAADPEVREDAAEEVGLAEAGGLAVPELLELLLGLAVEHHVAELDHELEDAPVGLVQLADRRHGRRRLRDQ